MKEFDFGRALKDGRKAACRTVMAISAMCREFEKRIENLEKKN